MTASIRTAVIIMVLGVQSLLSQDVGKSFPQAYFGIYKGILHIDNPAGGQDIPMEFHLVEGDSIDQYSYSIVYGEGAQKQERNYSLIAEDREQGQYVLDENNGIILDEKQLDNRLYCLFEVNGNLLTTFITFGEDHLLWELVFASKSNARTSNAENDEQTEVISYPITTVQRAVLKKQ